VALVAAIAVPGAQEAVAQQACGSCNIATGECQGPTQPNQVCFGGENPDGSPFCTTNNGWECEIMTPAYSRGH
jgi:hypothetical protein